MVGKFAKKLDSEKNIKLIYGEEVIEKIIERGYDKIFGARSINRYIADNIEDIVAKKMISQEVQAGGEVTIQAEDLK